MSLRRRKRRKNSYDIPTPPSVGKWVLRLSAAFFFLLFLLLISLYFGTGAYLRSENFRALAEKSAQKQLQAKVALSPFLWEGKTVHVSSFEAQEGHLESLGKDVALSELKVEDLQATFDYDKLWERAVFCPQLSAQKIQLSLSSLSQENKEKKSTEETAEATSLEDLVGGSSLDVEIIEEEPEPDASSQSPAWYHDFLPKSFSFGTIEIAQFNLDYQKEDELFSLKNAQLKVLQESSKKTYKLSLNKGQLSLPYSFLPAADLESLQARCTPKEIFLQELKGSLPTGGRLALEGNWLLEEKSGSLLISLTDVPLEQLISPRWSRSLKGTLKTTSTLTQSTDKEPHLKGQVSLDKAVLTALPVLDTLAAFTQTTRFRQLGWEKAEASYTYEKNRLSLQNIVLNSEGLLRLEGHLSLQGEALSGTLFVGIPASLLHRLPLGENDVFSSQTYGGKYGYRWAKVTLSGTKSAPKEDLSAQLLAAAGERLFTALPETGTKILDFTRSTADILLQSPANKNPTEENPHNPTKDDTPPIKMGEDLLKSALEQGLDLLR